MPFDRRDLTAGLPKKVTGLAAVRRI